MKSRDFDRNVTFTSISAVTRKWNVAGVYLHIKTVKFTYNCITTMNFLTNFTITNPVHQKVSRLFGPRYIGDDFFLGPNLSLIQSNCRSLRNLKS
jgi:hypothetical protein